MNVENSLQCFLGHRNLHTKWISVMEFIVGRGSGPAVPGVGAVWPRWPGGGAAPQNTISVSIGSLCAIEPKKSRKNERCERRSVRVGVRVHGLHVSCDELLHNNKHTHAHRHTGTRHARAHKHTQTQTATTTTHAREVVTGI